MALGNDRWDLLPDQAIPRTISEGRAKFRENNKTLLWDEFSLSLER